MEIEPTSQWDGDSLTGIFLRNEASNHKPRRLTGKVEAEKMGTVMCVQSTELLPSIFNKLSTEGFLSAPVCSGGELVGQLTLLDIVKHVNGLFYGTTEEDWIDWFDKKLMFQTTPASTIMEEPNEYLRSPYKTLNEHFTSFSALELMGREKNHQVLLLDDTKKLSGILTQSMLISFLRQNKHKWGADFSQLKIRDFEYDKSSKRPVQTIKEDELAINAFLRMEEEDVHGLPIVDSSGVLTGCISVRDLRGVGTDGTKFYRLYRTVRAFKDLVRNEHEALAPTTHYSKERVPTRGVYVTPDDTMETVITKMNDGNLHRIFVCSSESARVGRPVPTGVVSQSDVLYNTLQTIINSSRSSGGARIMTGTKTFAPVRQAQRKISPRHAATAKATQPSPGKRSIPIM